MPFSLLIHSNYNYGWQSLENSTMVQSTLLLKERNTTHPPPHTHTDTQIHTTTYTHINTYAQTHTHIHRLAHREELLLFERNKKIRSRT